MKRTRRPKRFYYCDYEEVDLIAFSDDLKILRVVPDPFGLPGNRDAATIHVVAGIIYPAPHKRTLAQQPPQSVDSSA